MSPLIMYITSSLGSTWNSLRPARPRATKAIESSVCHSTLIGLVAPAISLVIWSRSIARMAFMPSSSRSIDREQSPRVVHQDGVDLSVRKSPPPHQRHDVAEDVAVAVTAPADQTRAIANVVRDEDLGQVPALDQPAD